MLRRNAQAAACPATDRRGLTESAFSDAKSRKRPHFLPPRPVEAIFREITREPLLSFGQLQGSTHPANGQIQGICLEKSQPVEPTFAGHLRPFKQTFARVNAPAKPPFALIP
jgi:hypothetical protein